MRIQSCLDCAVSDDFLEVHFSLPFYFDLGEEVSQKSEEDIQISEGNFRQVKVSECSHEQGGFRDSDLVSFEDTGYHEHGFDGSQSPIVVKLF